MCGSSDSSRFLQDIAQDDDVIQYDSNGIPRLKNSEGEPSKLGVGLIIFYIFVFMIMCVLCAYKCFSSSKNIKQKNKSVNIEVKARPVV